MEAQAPQQTSGRRRGDRRGNRVGSVAVSEALERSTPGCCCRLGRTMMGPAKETQPREREHEDTHEQKEEHMKRHKDPHGVKFEIWKA